MDGGGGAKRQASLSSNFVDARAPPTAFGGPPSPLRGAGCTYGGLARDGATAKSARRARFVEGGRSPCADPCTTVSSAPAERSAAGEVDHPSERSERWMVEGALEAPLSSSSNNRRGAVAELADQ